MKALTLIAVLVLVFPFGQGYAQSETAPRGRTIQGKVEVEGGGILPVRSKPSLAMLRVEAQDPEGIVGDAVDVAADGAFTLSLHPGEYRISTRLLPHGYEIRRMSAGTLDLRTRNLQVSASGELEPIRIMLSVHPGVTVSGRIVGLPDTAFSTTRWVQLRTSTDPEGDDRLQSEVAIRADGTFEFFNVPPGEHSLVVYPRSRSEENLSATVVVESRNVEVTLGEELNSPRTPVKIPIHVVDEEGHGIAGARVLLADYVYNALVEDFVTTDSAGRTTFDATLETVPAKIMLIGYGSGGRLGRTAYSTLEEAVSKGMQLTLRQGLTVDGRIADANGNPIARTLMLWFHRELRNHRGKRTTHGRTTSGRRPMLRDDSGLPDFSLATIRCLPIVRAALCPSPSGAMTPGRNWATPGRLGGRNPLPF